MKRSIVGMLILMITMTGCATAFTGSAHINRQDCEKKCSDWGMSLNGMVAMGNYSDACVCKGNDKSSSSNGIDDLISDAPSAAGGAVGVMMQMQATQHHHH